MTGSRFLAAFAASDDKLVLEAVALPERAVRSSSDLFLEGNSPDLLYILTEGWAYRYKTTRAGDRQIVALIVPGDIANLDTLMFGRADFGVRTLTEGKVVAIPCAELLAVASYHGGIAKVLSRRTRPKPMPLSPAAVPSESGRPSSSTVTMVAPSPSRSTTMLMRPPCSS